METSEVLPALVAVLGLWALVVVATYHTVAWLRSRRKRPGPRPRHLHEITIAEQAWRDGWTEAYWSMGWNKAPSPPSSQATPGQSPRPQR